MGVLSASIVGPCVATVGWRTPLYQPDTQRGARGQRAVCLGPGMGVPLLAVGFPPAPLMRAGA